MYHALLKTKLFLLSYLVLVLPTGLADAGIIAHNAILYGLSMVGIWAICLIRGHIIGKYWLVAIPSVAFVFDLMPALAAIGLVPYLYHLLAMVIGAACLADAPPASDLTT
ncbi:hypothetical protein [Methylophilus sp.]|jgi:hypothetical protein|uniref:hypothetical protein n=1 Tax=Methylophilus sp. TaxID=29541 RepID=UPI0011D8A2BD|nr:hypothetical protein [Methylophilus sp.]TXI45512.1 MAG: hypothetical protein E6Q52_05885 [Methylophilus sp.]